MASRSPHRDYETQTIESVLLTKNLERYQIEKLWQNQQFFHFDFLSRGYSERQNSVGGHRLAELNMPPILIFSTIV